MKTTMPLPFFADGRAVKNWGHGHAYTVARIDPNDKFTPESRPDFAAYLTHAANLYPELVEACQLALEHKADEYRGTFDSRMDNDPLVIRLRAVLAKAKGE